MMGIARSLSIFMFLISTLLSQQTAKAASANGTATAQVVVAISIAAVSNLDFGVTFPGDIQLIVPPGAAENASNGSFTVTGDPNRAYTITLPTTINIITGAGGANRTIVVDTFTSNPSGTGLLGAGGTQTLFIGARRAALPLTQVIGVYSGTYTVTVVY
jgi:hypothetical protein